jgi:hypothetical protein
VQGEAGDPQQADGPDEEAEEREDADLLGRAVPRPRILVQVGQDRGVLSRGQGKGPLATGAPGLTAGGAGRGAAAAAAVRAGDERRGSGGGVQGETPSEVKGLGW